MKDLIIAPSVLSLDYADSKKDLEGLMASEAKWLHFDVMDGHFVPNLTFGPDILKAFKKKTNLFMDVHIMVDNPAFIAKIFADANADLITFHYEAMENAGECLELIKLIHSRKVKAGISIKPKTDVKVLTQLLPFVDLVLIMSVEPGFGGQKFIDDSLLKIKYLSDFKRENNLSFRIEVDGGINEETAIKCVKQGADTLVAGSFIFKNDIIESVSKLLKCQK